MWARYRNHGRWRLAEERKLGVDRLEVYERVRRP